MSIHEVIAKYLQFLLEQLQQDIHVITTWWVYSFVLPLCVYIMFFLVKWWMLLVPVTLPLTMLLASRTPAKGLSWFKSN